MEEFYQSKVKPLFRRNRESDSEAVFKSIEWVFQDPKYSKIIEKI